jgi:hypothetical protein
MRRGFMKDGRPKRVVTLADRKVCPTADRSAPPPLRLAASMAVYGLA